MELIGFLIVVLIGNLISFYKLSAKKLMAVNIFIMMSLMLLVRISGFDTDISTYIVEMKSNTIDFYYLREFVFWFPMRWLYLTFENEYIVLLIIDFIWIYSLSLACKILNCQKYFLLICCSFISFLGFENILRQHLATCLLILSFAFSIRVSLKAHFFALISTLTHNGVVFVAFYSALRKLNLFKTIVIFSLIGFIAIYYFLNADISTLKMFSKSNIKESGADLTSLYFVYFVLTSFLIFVMKYKSLKHKLLMLYMLVIGAFLWALLTGPLVERVFQVFLFVLIILYFNYLGKLEKKFNKIFYLGVYQVMYVVPIFVSSSTLSFFNAP